MKKLSRRRLLELAPAALAGLAFPRRSRAAPSGADRRFLFVFANGGWDPTHVFVPAFDNGNVDMESDAAEASAGDLVYVDHPDRPSVTSFMEANAHRTAFLSGFEVRSITHFRCRQMLFTGRGASDGEDWGAILAASSGRPLSLPSLVLSGPTFTSRLSSMVVRSGRSQQLEDLLDGTALSQTDQRPSLLSESAGSAVDAYLLGRTESLAAAESGPRARYLEGYTDAQLGLADLRDLGLDLGATDDVPAGCGGVYDQLSIAINALASGATRCATVEYSGECSVTFDDHTNIAQHSLHWEGLFAHLDWALQLLDATPGPAGGTLADETVVVVLSEMGRHPRINSYGGKDHWTFTSAMLVGSGVAGGRMVGDYDEFFMGRPVDTASGDSTESGVSLTPAHLGATLMALGDVDPLDWGEAEPILGLLS